MIPDGRPPNVREFDRVLQVICNRTPQLTDWLASEGITDVTGEDVLRCIVNSWPKDDNAP